jgi:hypothetical protein
MSAVLASVKWMSLSKVLAIRSGQLIESKKCPMMVPCMTFYGQILKR